MNGHGCRRAALERASRQFLIGVAALLLLAGACPCVLGQTFPSRPVRLIVGTAPGGGVDIVARLLAAKLQEQFSEPVAVENRPGSSGGLAAEFVANAAPDGHTLLAAFAGQMVMNPVVQEGVPYDPVRDFEPVTMLGLFPVVLVTNTALPPNSLQSLVAYARANPGKLNYASGSAGFFYITEAFKQATKSDILSVPYTGSASAVNAVLAGTVDMAFVDIPPAIAHIKSGRLKALGVTTAQRVGFLPDVPAIAETVPGYEFVLWTGMFAPARTPKDIVARLQQEIVRAVDSSGMKEKMMSIGVLPATGTPQELGDTVRRYLGLVRGLHFNAGQRSTQQQR